MAYPTYLAATLSGATQRQLAYWRRGPEALLVPELGRVGGRWLYSFRDVVALRTFVYLRQDVSLQRVRKAVDTLRTIEAKESSAAELSERHLANYTLCVAGDSVVWRRPDGSFVDLVESPGSLRIEVVMHDVFGPFENLQGEQVVALYEPRPHVRVDPETQGGYPVIEGTRVEYDLVASLVRDGVSPSKVRAIYPGVSARAARSAAEFLDLVERHRNGSRAAAS